MKSYQRENKIITFLATPFNVRLISQFNKDLQEGYMRYLVASNKSKGTLITYESNLNIFFSWNLLYNSNKAFTKITKQNYIDFVAFARTECDWSDARIKTLISTISSFEKWYMRTYSDVNKTYKPKLSSIKIELKKTRKNEVELNDNLVQRILKYLVDSHEYEMACVFALATFSGRKRNELLRFKVEYFKDKNLICNGGLYKTNEEVVVGGYDNGSDKEYMYVLAKDFKPYFDLWMKEREKKGIKSEWLFPSPINPKVHAGRNTTDNCSMYVSNYLKRPFSWQRAKIYFIEKLINSGLPRNVVKEVSGVDETYINNKDNRLDEEILKDYFDEDGIRIKERLKKI